MKKLQSVLSGLMLLAGTAFAQPQIVEVSGDITGQVTWTSDKSYLLKGFVRVQSGGELTIQPGTIIYGENATQGSFIVKPGGKVIAEGTEYAPIVFTSEFAKPGSSVEPARGDWGGVILLGKAPINPAGGTSSIEGPGDSYGGSDPEDNSGVLKYVRIEYAGIAFTPNNEINGLTFGGVGRGTTIDYVQVSWANDDSFEWFGGTVNAKHLIAYQGLDDDFDTDFGFSGKLQFLLSIRDKEIADVSGSNGFESDNDATGSTSSPRTSPTWYNVTLIGPAETKSTTFNSNYKRGM
ncbi:MAG: T9SS C-terminal target domain-containing protein, partial [Bacteroidetes bacterium]|nr:T9SS C-terminal target domain-containing protein [Bacteroidota bacterium]